MTPGFALRRIADPAVEPITLERARLHCRVNHTAEDALLTSLIVAAREHAENYLRRSLVQQDWRLTLDSFARNQFCCSGMTGVIYLPRSPVLEILEISYVDDAGVTQTLQGYQVDTESVPARLSPAYAETWPTTREVMNAVSIEYRAGYAPTADSPPDPAGNIPQAIKQAMLLMIGHLFENREQTIAGVSITTVPVGYEPLMAPYRILGF